MCGNFQNIADKTFHTAQAIEKLKNLTSSNSYQSLHQILNNQETNTDLQKIINCWNSQNNDQSGLISDLQKRNSRLLKTRRVRISVIGIGAGQSYGTGVAAVTTIREIKQVHRTKKLYNHTR